MQTLGYRAPEVHFGDERFSYPVDLFSLGCVLFNVTGAGGLGLRGERDSDWTAALFHQLGSPTDPVIRQLPLFPRVASVVAAQPMPSVISTGYGAQGSALIRELLAYSPRERITVGGALGHPFMRVRGFDLGGETEAGWGESSGWTAGGMGSLVHFVTVPRWTC